jgi:hypothetical protein
LTVEPRQLVRHLMQLIPQRADQLHGLGGINFIHAGMVAPLAAFRRVNGSGRDYPLDKRAVVGSSCNSMMPAGHAGKALAGSHGFVGHDICPL